MAFSSALHNAFLLAVIFALLCQTAASPSFHAERAPDDSSAPDEQCGFTGNSDVYGLGIRLGVYIQWITTSIANNFLPDDAPGMRNTNYAFLLSNFIGLIYVTSTKGSTLDNGQLYSVEAWIILSLCIFGTSTAKGKWAPGGNEGTFAVRKRSNIEGILKDLLSMAISYYGLWFVFHGMDTMAHPPCSQSAFFFAKVNLFHWFRTLLKIGYVIANAYNSIFFLLFWFFAIKDTCTDGLDGLKALIGVDEDPTGGNDSDSDNSKIHIKKLSIGYGLFFFVISIELMIKWNHIDGLYELNNTGQLIPLVVSLYGLVQVVYNLIGNVSNDKYEFDDDCTCFCCICTCPPEEPPRWVTYSRNYGG